MTGTRRGQKTIYLDTDNATLQPDGEALRVSQPAQSDWLIPLRRVERAVVQHGTPDLLQACLAIVRNGGTVHFQEASGNLCAILQQPWADGTRWARDTARIIEHTSGRATYRRWRNAQRRHAWSLVFRRNHQGDFESNRQRFVRYLLFFRPDIDIPDELEWLEQQLWAWLQARLNRDGLQPIVRALAAKGDSLIHDLAPLLSLRLLWLFVRWRRHQPNALIRDRTHFFELQARTRLADQLQRHLRAMGEAYYERRQVEETDLGTLADTYRQP